ncbi:MAG: Txe/YoeB family addiction module toxin [Muribaculaceae bacterium]|nr:Txe/YoeB family addiction module toxin [Muribaculaceae bacterium]
MAKIAKLLKELTEHQRSGTGQIEQLKGDFSGLWSRRIDKASRMIYSIENDKVIVTVISLKGHYNDK